MSDSEMLRKGREMRREVLGAEYVEANLGGADDFMMKFQDLVTELAWGHAWSGIALSKKEKSILSPGILAALGRFQEVGIYTAGALTNGMTVDEIKEVLVHVTVYCGTPTGRHAFLAAHDALVSAGAI